VTSWSQGGSFYHCAKAPLYNLTSTIEINLPLDIIKTGMNEIPCKTGQPKIQ
jgi:hypothetical protein